MEKWEIVFDKYYDKLESYVEKYSPIFFLISMFYLAFILIINHFGNV